MKSKDEKYLLNKMRTTVNGGCQSVMIRTVCIRKVKHFPRGGNQARYLYLCYDFSGSILMCLETLEISCCQLRIMLPLRICVIEDDNYLSRKEFDNYKHMAYHII